MQGVKVTDTWDEAVPMQHVSSENHMDDAMQQDKQNPCGTFISESKAESHEQGTIREIAAQEIQHTVENSCNTHTYLPCTQAVDDDKNNACNYIDCILCKRNTRKNVHAFHIMQRALYASNTVSLQAIYDTFYAEKTLTNFDSFTELHNEFQLVQKDLVPSSLIIAVTIQKQRSSIPLKAFFDPGSDLTFVHERCIPKGATPVVSLTTTGTTLAGTFTTSRFVTLEKILLPEFHRSCRIDSHICYLIYLSIRCHRWMGSSH
jgi:hypothetical protein